MKAYSLDLRQKVLAAALRGDRTVREVAESFACRVKKSLAASERNNYKRGWFRRRARRVNHRRLIFVDETAVNTAMTRRYGRAPRGERAHDSAPRNYGTHISVIGAMGLRGLVATLAVEGAADTLCFDAYAEQVLGPRPAAATWWCSTTSRRTGRRCSG